MLGCSIVAHTPIELRNHNKRAQRLTCNIATDSSNVNHRTRLFYDVPPPPPSLYA